MAWRGNMIMAHNKIQTKYDDIHGTETKLQRRLGYIKTLKTQQLKSVPNRTVKS